MAPLPLHFDSDRVLSNPTEVSVSGPMGAHDSLRAGGVLSVSHQLAPHHPLFKGILPISEEEVYRRERLSKLDFGLHMPIRLDNELSIVSGTARLTPLKSSLIGRDALLGLEDVLSVEEVLNDPFSAPDYQSNASLIH